MESILNAIYKNYRVIKNPEITLEANPDDLLEDVIKGLAKSKVNRLSIGIQSFFEDDLKNMNRAHNAEEAKACLALATSYFDNITVDLIYGVPNMSLEKWDANIETVFNFGINHISSYALTVETNTALDNFIKKGAYPAIDEDLAFQHFTHLMAKTAGKGFVHYEISNFGKPDYFSKHNTSYWQGKPYLGIGPSAHSFSGTERGWNVRNNSIYINSLSHGVLPMETEQLTNENKYNEYIMTGLRTIWGVSLDKIEADFGIDYLHHLIKASQKFITEGVLQLDNNALTATSKGKFLIDGIASELFMV